MAIGGAIGGAVDPTKVNGPHIGDGQQQTATDGSPIAWVLGTASIAGTIAQVSKRREVKVKDSGKGSGTVVSHYENRQDFAILVCESCELRNSTIDAVLMVIQDGVIVYDVRAGSTMLKASAKWKAGVDFQFGDEDQMPHPTLEAITGVGNTPSYRGVCTAVFKNFNITASGGRIPNFSFLVSSSCVTTYPAQTSIGVTGVSGGASEFVKNTGQFYVNPGQTVPTLMQCSLDITRLEYDPATLIRMILRLYSPTGPIIWDSGWYGPAVPALADLRAYLEANPSVTIGDSFDTGAAFGYTARVGPGSPVMYYEAYCYDKAAATDPSLSFACIAKYYTLPGTPTYAESPLDLADVVSRVCLRGGILSTDIDVTALVGIAVVGYPIAKQMTAIDALAPLLQAFFAYGSEYDGKIYFKRYGADSVITIADADLLEANDANDNNVTSTLRNQATEFPRKITASYLDPAQNYTPVTIEARRLAIDVIAIGETTMSIPVVMPANQAKQAGDKALKIAYATLEGTQEYSVPFGGSAAYLSICAGDPVIFRGKRWVADEVILSNGYLKLKARYDRQSAYTSILQAVVGNPPSVPPSPYSGPTTLLAMNLPTLRVQDSYGLYLAVAPQDPAQNWQGCTIQISYDGQVTWVNATQATQASTLGTIVANEPTGGEPLTVLVGGTLESVTTAQIAAQANAFCVQHASGDEIGQFQTATEDMTIVDQYALTDVTRGGLRTPRAPCVAGDAFTMLDSVYFLPILPTYAGDTLYLRAVGYGEAAEDAEIVSVVYEALAPTDYTIYGRITEDGSARVDESNDWRILE